MHSSSATRALVTVFEKCVITAENRAVGVTVFEPWTHTPRCDQASCPWPDTKPRVLTWGWNRGDRLTLVYCRLLHWLYCRKARSVSYTLQSVETVPWRESVVELYVWHSNVPQNFTQHSLVLVWCLFFVVVCLCFNVCFCCCCVCVPLESHRWQKENVSTSWTCWFRFAGEILMRCSLLSMLGSLCVLWRYCP